MYSKLNKDVLYEYSYIENARDTITQSVFLLYKESLKQETILNLNLNNAVCFWFLNKAKKIFYKLQKKVVLSIFVKEWKPIEE